MIMKNAISLRFSVPFSYYLCRRQDGLFLKKICIKLSLYRKQEVPKLSGILPIALYHSYSVQNFFVLCSLKNDKMRRNVSENWKI